MILINVLILWCLILNTNALTEIEKDTLELNQLLGDCEVASMVTTPDQLTQLKEEVIGNDHILNYMVTNDYIFYNDPYLKYQQDIDGIKEAVLNARKVAKDDYLMATDKKSVFVKHMEALVHKLDYFYGQMVLLGKIIVSTTEDELVEIADMVLNTKPLYNRVMSERLTDFTVDDLYNILPEPIKHRIDNLEGSHIGSSSYALSPQTFTGLSLNDVLEEHYDLFLNMTIEIDGKQVLVGDLVESQISIIGIFRKIITKIKILKIEITILLKVIKFIKKVEILEAKLFIATIRGLQALKLIMKLNIKAIIKKLLKLPFTVPEKLKLIARLIMKTIMAVKMEVQQIIMNIYHELYLCFKWKVLPIYLEVYYYFNHYVEKFQFMFGLQEPAEEWLEVGPEVSSDISYAIGDPRFIDELETIFKDALSYKERHDGEYYNFQEL